MCESERARERENELWREREERQRQSERMRQREREKENMFSQAVVCLLFSYKRDPKRTITLGQTLILSKI